MPLLGENESVREMQEAQQVCACQVLTVVASCLDSVHPSPLVWLAQSLTGWGSGAGCSYLVLLACK